MPCRPDKTQNHCYLIQAKHQIAANKTVWARKKEWHMIRKFGWHFVVIAVVALLLLLYFLAGPAIRYGMIQQLEQATGAEVNIDKVALQFAPLGLRINQLQLTDAARPTHNSLNFAQATADLEIWPALQGYYIINELNIDGLQYGAARQSKGKVYRAPDTTADNIDLATLLQVDLPDADELIARAKLETPAKAAALKQLALTEQQQLKTLQEKLPGKETLAQYQQEIKALTDSKIDDATELTAKAQQLQQLKGKLTTEKAKVEQVRQQLTQSKDALSQAVAELNAARKSDWAKLQQLANLKDGGLAGISQILLGDAWAERVTQLQSLYLLAKPYIDQQDTAKATDTTADQAYPDFWVKQARVNWLLGGGEAVIALQDITAQHALIKRATQFSLDAKQLPLLDAFALSGDFAVLQHMVTNINWQLSGLQLTPVTLGNTDHALNLAAGLLSSNGTLQLTDNHITQQAKVVLNAADFSSSDNKYLQQLASLLNQQQQIPLSIATTGLLTEPKVSIRSSLDKLLGDALLGEAKQKVAAYQSKLQGKLDAQLQTGLAAEQDWAALITQQDGATADISASIEHMLSAKLADVKDQAKDKLKDKLLKKIGG
jgi:uncharacterized protein (TIGR03545 family)